MNELQIIELFCQVDDFIKRFNPMCITDQIQYKKKKIRNRPSRISLVEIMGILLLFHQFNYRAFKHFYLEQVRNMWRPLFPKIVGYSRFIQLMPEAFFPMFCFLKEHQGISQGINFLDSTILTSCHIRRASSHRTFRGVAKKGKTTTGWFFGFKLHLVINHYSEIVAFRLTNGNVDDRKPVPRMAKNIKGKLFADRGYISEALHNVLMEKGIFLVTKLKKNMKNKLMSLWDKILLRKRGLIESVHNLLKNECQIEHHRHRSRWNFLSNLLAGLAAYCLKPDKPRLYCSRKEID